MNDIPHQDGAAFFNALEKAIAYGGTIGDMSIVDAFDIAANHVAALLGDAVDTFQRKSYGTCVFLAITAIEETAKAELLAFRANQPDDGSKRGRDPLHIHFEKHVIAIRSTTFMGRLPKILGNSNCKRIKREAETGELVKLREQSLYIHASKDGVTAPATSISRTRAQEVLLLALESADDILVGWTNASYSLGQQFECWIASVNSSELSGDEST